MAYQKIGDIVKTTNDNRTYNRAIKMKREMDQDVSCSICGYHAGCNHNNKAYKMKNWKYKVRKQNRNNKGNKRIKNLFQYKPVVMEE